VTIYRAMPYLLAAVPPVVMLLTILIAGCTMSRTAPNLADNTRFYSDPNSRAGEELVEELDRRAAREDLRRLIEEEGR
jgi:hypothetical protein